MVKTEIIVVEGKGKGLISKEFIPKGKIIFNFANENTKLITEEEYLELVKGGDINAIRTGCKVMPGYFVLYNSTEPNKCEYINHSFNPTMAYYFGLCIASSDIQPGEELTIDYSFLVANTDEEIFIDAETNTKVTGVSNEEYYNRTIETMSELLGRTY